MGGVKETEFLQEWELVRNKGLYRHCFKLAAIWGLPMFLIMTFIVQSPPKSVLATYTYDTRLIISNFIIYTVAGFLMGLWIWHGNEKKYKKAKGIGNAEETNSVSFSDELELKSKEACEAAIKHAWIFAVISALIAAFAVTCSPFALPIKS